MKTRITALLGIEHPIFQAAMSWASSNSALVTAGSNAGGMGVLAAGPMRPQDFKKALLDIREGTAKPYGVNIPLNSPRAAELLDIAYEARIPVMVASQGGPREHLARFRAIGTKWLHVVASVEHASKAEAAGVDALVVDEAEFEELDPYQRFLLRRRIEERGFVLVERVEGLNLFVRR